LNSLPERLFINGVVEFAPGIGDEFAVIQELEIDPCAGVHGVHYVSPVGRGLGKLMTAGGLRTSRRLKKVIV